MNTEEALSGEAVERLIQQADQIHSAPQVALSLLKLTRDVDFDIDEVVHCIERDPALVARMLRIVNSSRYGLRHPVSNLRTSITYLGQRTLRLIAMTFSLVEVFMRGPAKQLYNDYWTHALTMATASARLVRNVADVQSHDAYTAGLLADLGTLLLAQTENDRYIALYREKQSGADLIAAERAAFGFDHAMVSARLLKKWGFPDDLVQAAAEHHSSDSLLDPLSTAVKAGDLVADVLWTPESTSVDAAREWLDENYSLDLDGFTDLALACKEDITLEAEVFGIHLDTSIDFKAILIEAHRRYMDSSLDAAIDLDSLTSVIDDPYLPLFEQSTGWHP